MIINPTIQLALVIAIPTAVLLASRYSKAVRVVTPVLVCYLAGLVLGNQGLIEFDSEQSLLVSTVTVAMAIPLLLFSVDIIGWLRLAKATVISFSLCIVSAFVVSIATSFMFAGALPDSDRVSSMLIGVYIGGTPNMAAIGTALGVEPETFMMLNSTDMIWSTLYLMFLLTIAGRFYALFLPPFPKRAADTDAGALETTRGLPPVKFIVMGTALAASIVAAAGGGSLLFPESYQDAVAILIITTLSIGVSLFPGIRRMRGTSEAGNYFLLVFCVAIGTTAHFEELLVSSGTIFLITGTVLFGSVIVHLLLSTVFRLDRDTVIITSTAAIWGPAIIAPVAIALKNREIVVSGIASGLVGYAVGNYMGLAVAWFLSGMA